MVALIVILEGQDSPEAVCNGEIVAVVGILFGNFGGDKFLTGHLHAFYKTCNAGAKI